MSKHSDHVTLSRRRFLEFGAISVAAMPLAGAALAQGGQKIDEKSEAAKALGYHNDAGKVTDPKRKKDQFCHNCQFFQGKPSDAWAPCPVLGGKDVANKGWCITWTAKA
jgi:hypothetical protein